MTTPTKILKFIWTITPGRRPLKMKLCPHFKIWQAQSLLTFPLRTYRAPSSPLLLLMTGTFKTLSPIPALACINSVSKVGHLFTRQNNFKIVIET